MIFSIENGKMTYAWESKNSKFRPSTEMLSVQCRRRHRHIREIATIFPSEMILHRHAHTLAPPKRYRRLLRPIRIAQKCPPEHYHVGLSLTDDLVGLSRFGNQTDRCDRD